MAFADFTSADINPIDFASDWSFVTMAGVQSPGVIAVDGIRGFERETGWDTKKGKGTQGATLSLTTFPPAEGSIEFVLWLASHFTQWQKFRAGLKYNPGKKQSATAADALDIYHPALADLEITQVVTHKISPIYHRGGGRYVVIVDFIEWLKPPPVSIVATTASSKPNDGASSPGSQPDPVGDAQQKQIADLMKKGAGTPVGF